MTSKHWLVLCLGLTGSLTLFVLLSRSLRRSRPPAEIPEEGEASLPDRVKHIENYLRTLPARLAKSRPPPQPPGGPPDGPPFNDDQGAAIDQEWLSV